MGEVWSRPPARVRGVGLLDDKLALARIEGGRDGGVVIGHQDRRQNDEDHEAHRERDQPATAAAQDVALDLEDLERARLWRVHGRRPLGRLAVELAPGRVDPRKRLARDPARILCGIACLFRHEPEDAAAREGIDPRLAQAIDGLDVARGRDAALLRDAARKTQPLGAEALGLDRAQRLGRGIGRRRIGEPRASGGGCREGIGAEAVLDRGFGGGCARGRRRALGGDVRGGGGWLWRRGGDCPSLRCPSLRGPGLRGSSLRGSGLRVASLGRIRHCACADALGPADRDAIAPRARVRRLGHNHTSGALPREFRTCAACRP